MARGLSRLGAQGAALAALLSTGCIDASARVSAAQQPAEATAPLTKTCSNGTRAAADGAVDDAEDHDTQLTKVGGRDGYWFTSADPNGSTLQPSPFKMTEGGANGSKWAVHIAGTTSSVNGAWGILIGANMVGAGAYDASPYTGISFKAKIGPKSTSKVRFKVGDVNTHPDGGVCKSCWNHFGKDLTLSNDWQTYSVSFAEMTQEAGWGDRIPKVTPGKLLSINWSIGPGQPYDLWLDDVEFFECR